MRSKNYRKQMLKWPRASRERRKRSGYPVFFCGSSNFSPFLNTP